MKIRTLRALKDNFIYILEGENGDCAVIDPGEAPPVEDFLSAHKLKLKKILCTHHHWDHVNGVADLAERHGASVLCSQHDLPRVPKASEGLSEGGTYRLFGEDMQILDLPGHTLGQIAFWFPKSQALFAGDTLFSCGCGRLFEGTPDQMYSSLQKLKSLPPETELYFGHEYTLNNIRFVRAQNLASAALDDYQRSCEKKQAAGLPTTPVPLKIEFQINPFLTAKSVEEFKRWREARNTW